jgi:hypothetical protein
MKELRARSMVERQAGGISSRLGGTAYVVDFDLRLRLAHNDNVPAGFSIYCEDCGAPRVFQTA